MATWITPIVDRSQTDVDRIKELKAIGYFNMTAEEKAEWQQDSKGCLNRSDLTRIENNIKVIVDKLNISQALASVPEIPNVTYYTQLRSRVVTIRENAICYSTTPQVPLQPFNHFQKINDIEQILFDTYKILIDNEAEQVYCYEDPEIYCDNDNIA